MTKPNDKREWWIAERPKQWPKAFHEYPEHADPDVVVHVVAMADVQPLLEALQSIVSHSHSWVITEETGAIRAQVHGEYRKLAIDALEKWNGK